MIRTRFYELIKLTIIRNKQNFSTAYQDPWDMRTKNIV